ncbi:MAG: hypothetical protein GKR86_02020 [Ilumatobacter sp.]|jgi:cytochrome c oxidase subunit IV|nr:cytochrome C oxidase subunit IV family protein [bacterium]NKB39832.1 hypothetical protein [Ilumatobacter sp.]
MTDVEASPATEHEHHLHGHHADAGHDGEHGPHDAVSDNRYIVIAVILAVITAAEVAASYIDLGAVFIPLLLFMMAVKFFIVASFFMHLRFDNRVFTWLFYTGVVLAVVVYVIALLTFRFFEA